MSLIQFYRLKGAYDDMTSVCSILDWRGNTRLAQLGGIFPMDESVPFDTQLQKRLYDFSVDRTTKLVSIAPIQADCY